MYVGVDLQFIEVTLSYSPPVGRDTRRSIDDNGKRDAGRLDSEQRISRVKETRAEASLMVQPHDRIRVVVTARFSVGCIS